MNHPTPGSKWRHHKTGATYTVVAVQCDRNIQPISIFNFPEYAEKSLALPLNGSLWRLLSDRYNSTMVFYCGESGQWCRTLYDFCGLGDNGEKRFVEVKE